MSNDVTAAMFAGRMPDVSVTTCEDHGQGRSVTLEVGRFARLESIPEYVAIALMWELIERFLPNATVSVKT